MSSLRLVCLLVLLLCYQLSSALTIISGNTAISTERGYPYIAPTNNIPIVPGNGYNPAYQAWQAQQQQRALLQQQQLENQLREQKLQQQIQTLKAEQERNKQLEKLKTQCDNMDLNKAGYNQRAQCNAINNNEQFGLPMTN